MFFVQYNKPPRRKSVTWEAGSGAGTERVYDVDDETVARGPHAQWSRAHEEADDVEEVGKVSGHVEAVVEGQHEQIPG